MNEVSVDLIKHWYTAFCFFSSLALYCCFNCFLVEMVQGGDADRQIPDTKCSDNSHYISAMVCLCFWLTIVNKCAVFVCKPCRLSFISMIRLQSIDKFAYLSYLSLTPAKSVNGLLCRGNWKLMAMIWMIWCDLRWISFWGFV